jgi:exopolyphosphatase/guanosine-5'-triphosphate,3'-diphosphate pyrophosphatase
MLPGLENGRHEVIICGLFWLRSLLEKLRVETFKISTAGLRFGLLYPPEKEPEPKPKKRPAFLKKTDATSETAIPEQVGDDK